MNDIELKNTSDTLKLRIEGISESNSGRLERNSGIELLKIIAIFLIIISHISQAWTNNSGSMSGYVIDLAEFSLSNPDQSFILYLFQQFGTLGNGVFFICSAWFLIDSKKRYGKKIVTLLMEVWAVSVVFLAAVLLTKTVDINGTTILRCILPSTFCNNWYITYYCLFLAIVPYLNAVIDRLPQKKHLVFVLYIIVLDVVVESFTTAWANYIPSLSIDKWILVYFVIAYMKMYLPDFSSSTKMNAILLLLGTGVYAICVAYNTFGFTKNSIIVILLNGWRVRRFYLYVIAIALFNLFRKIKLRSSLINRISGYSLLIYIIHENLLIRKYYRPMISALICERFGYDHIVGWVLLLVLVTFICALVLSVFFDLTVGRIARRATEKYYSKLGALCNSILEKMVKVQ